MSCPACRAENPVAAKFCEECGAPQPRRCPACDHEVGAAAKFCLECGDRLGASLPAGPVSSAPLAPQSYTPRHLAERILAGRDALAGERKQVTVLFADVVGSTELVRGRDAEEAQRLLDGVVQVMMDAVHRYEGTVSRLMGDGLMAMFGAPVAHEDHAVRACYAALTMLEAAREYANEARRVHGAAIRIRVGINSGEVIVRLISDDLHMDYTAMGQTVHLASRMEGLASANTGLLTSDTLKLVEGFVAVRALGPTSVKGLDQPVDVYELVGAGPVRTRLQSAAARGFTRFVGRQRELAMIEAALEQARDGRGQVVALVGEPGVGKSRLVYETIRAAIETDWLALQSGAVAYARATSYLPIIDLLRNYCGIEPGDDVEAMRGRVTNRVLGLDRTLEPGLASLLSLLDLPVDDPSWAVLDPPRRRRATLDAVKRVLLRLSQKQPLLLVLEDLHWIDSESQAVLDELVEILPTSSLLLLVNYRPEYTHGWGNKSIYAQVRIDPLESASAEQLLQSQLGADTALDPLKRHLIERTGGNPLFLEESVRSLVETGVLVGQGGDYTLTRDVDEVSVPATVQAILAARIDRLGPDDKRVLQMAAVIGKDVPFELLQTVAETHDDVLHGLLSRLQSAELLYPTRLLPEPAYSFKHALTHEVTYRGLLSERRKMLHARVVEAIETRYPARLDEYVERLAHHAMHAEAWQQATNYARRAGARDLARSALHEAGAWFEQALTALSHLPDSTETLEQRIDLAIDLRNAINALGKIHRAFELLQAAQRLAEQIGDAARLGRVCVSMNSYHYITGDLTGARVTSERALSIARELDDLALEVTALQMMGQTALWMGEYLPARRHFLAVLAILRGEDKLGRVFLGSSSLLAVTAHGLLAWCLAEIGSSAEAIDHGEVGLRLADEASHTYSQCGASLQAGVAYLRNGALDRAVATLERGLGIARSAGFQTLSYFGIASFLGEAYVTTDRLVDAIRLLEDVVERGTALGAVSDYLLAMPPLAVAYARTGRPEDALPTATRAVELATRHGFRGLEAQARRALGEIHAQPELRDASEAESNQRAALKLAAELGMRPLQAHCHLGLGKLYRRTGRSDDARAELSTAVVMLREMKMTFWLPEAEVELAQVASLSMADGISPQRHEA